ncbi:hypothetical protein OC846_004532 [Tilletia horrida]|uniref:ZIP zinc/iron transport family n=1 Tax=Tilletia horrida TaxID=155126 RepID=A0AAN6JQB0_9BASI|nr:hypothetical protein OC845_004697 [Tilletia horrida]KAK0548283.1 hypothetical protein OC846_004532 [Tilletia horrida]
MSSAEGSSANAVELDKCQREEFTGSLGLRVGALFIIWVSSTCVTLFPIATKRIPRLAVPTRVFDFAKYFGSGVIIATAFIHLLAPGAEELGSPCLSESFLSYDFAYAFAMISMFFTFLVELLAFRIGSARAASLAYDPHTGEHHHHHANEHNAVLPPPPAAIEAPSRPAAATKTSSNIDDESSSSNQDVLVPAQKTSEQVFDEEVVGHHQHVSSAVAAQQILGVAILEFGVVFHSIIIGITLGTTSEFTTLFIVIIFHQMFEGLGLGARLAFLPLAPNSIIPFVGGILYGLVTPIGLAIGLAVRSTYNGNSATANYVTGTFDSVSAGILLYTGLVELLAHEFIFNQKMKEAPLGYVLLCIAEMFAGAGIMALLGKWA